jgi:hypothetical protein
LGFDLNFIVPPNWIYRGLSYGNWAATWWNWLFSNQEQVGSVYFLRGNTDLEQGIVRTGRNGLTLFSDTAIFFPIICTITSRLVFPNPVNEMTRRSESAERQREPSRLMVIIDDTGIPNLDEYYAESPEFILDVPESSPLRNCFEPLVQSGKGEAVTAGYWILIKPLPTGKHRIQFEGRHQDGFRTTGDYSIRVIKRTSFTC